MSNEQNQQPQRVAFVTGAAVCIGPAIAQALQTAGYRVVGGYRKAPATSWKRRFSERARSS